MYKRFNFNKLLINNTNEFTFNEVMITAMAKIIKPNIEVVRVDKIPEDIDKNHTLICERRRFGDKEQGKEGNPYFSAHSFLLDYHNNLCRDDAWKYNFKDAFMHSTVSLKNFIESFNPIEDENADYDKPFNQMVNLMKTSIENTITKYKQRKKYLMEKWEKAIEESEDGIVIMDELIELVYDQFILDQIIFIIYDYNGEYVLITTPKSLTSAKNKISIPDSIKDEPGCIKTRPFGNDNSATFDTLDHARNAALKLIKENAN